MHRLGPRAADRCCLLVSLSENTLRPPRVSCACKPCVVSKVELLDPVRGWLRHASPRDVAPLVQSSDGGVREQPRAGNGVPDNVSSNAGTILAAAED